MCQGQVWGRLLHGGLEGLWNRIVEIKPLPKKAVCRKWNQPKEEMYIIGNKSGREEQAKSF